eukprot:PhF_6_TR24803/c1_g1_i7/m.34133
MNVSVSLRTIPMVMAIFVLAVTAAICLGITSSTRETMKSLLRDASNNDIDNMYVTAADNVQRINREWQESITTSAKTFITSIVNLTYQSMLTYKEEMEYALRQVGPDGKTPLGLTREFHLDLIRRAYYDASTKPYGGMFAIMNIGGKKYQTIVIQSPWSINVYQAGDEVREFVYVYSNGSLVGEVNIPAGKRSTLSNTDLFVEYCPIDRNGGCNTTYFRNQTNTLSDGTKIYQIATNFPNYVSGVDMTPFITWGIGVSRLYGDVFWHPILEKDYYVSANVLTLIRSPLLPKDPVNGDVVGVVGAGIEIRSVSHYLRTIVKYPGQRI